MKNIFITGGSSGIGAAMWILDQPDHIDVSEMIIRALGKEF